MGLTVLALMVLFGVGVLVEQWWNETRHWR